MPRQLPATIRKSIKQRMLFSTAAFLLLVFSLTAIGTHWYFKQKIRELIAEQQFGMLDKLATALDAKVESTHNLLKTAASVAPPDLLESPHKTTKWLENRIALRNVFASGIFVFTPKGELFAKSPWFPERRCLDSSFYDHHNQSLLSASPLVFPYNCSVHNRPMVMLTAPAYDGKGNLIAILGGTVDLHDSTLFSNLLTSKIGETGYLYLYTKDRLMLSHPDDTLLFKDNVPRGANILLDRSVSENFEGVGECLNYKGVPVIASFRHMPYTGWIMASHYPTKEAFLPVVKFRNIYLSCVIVALITGIIWIYVMSSRITRNLRKLTNHLRQVDPRYLDTVSPVEIADDDETGLLADTFNTLLKQAGTLQSQLKQAQELTNTGSWEYDHITDQLSWSLETYRIFEQDPAQFKPTLESIFRLMPEEEAEQARIDFYNSIKGKSIHDFTHRLIFPDGRVKHIREHCQTSFDEDGTPLHSTGVAQDVTMQSFRRKRQELLFEAIAKTGTCLLLTGEDFRIRYANAAAVKRFGEHANRFCYELLSGSKAPCTGCRDLVGGFCRLETEITHPDGTIFHVVSTPFIDLDGSQALLSLLRDVTKESRLMQELQESELKFATAFKSNPAAMALICMDDSLIMDVNAAFTNLLGFTANEVIGKAIADLDMVVDNAQYLLIREQLHAQGRVHNQQIDFKTKTGEIRNGIFKADLIDLKQKRLILGVMLDITERIKAEQALEAARQAANAANRAKSEFLSNMSHEIRSLMNGVLGMTELLRFTDLTDEQKEFLDCIKLSGENLLELLNDILDLSKVESGKIELEKADFCLRKAINDIIKTQSSLAFKKSLKLLCNINCDVPRQVHGDSLRLKQILLNLINNAIKFTDKGSVTLNVCLLDEKDKTVLVRMSVCDTGIGIPAKVHERIFTPFSQADSSTSRKYGGTGLGLTTCKQLAALMDGSISLESEPGKGSCFHLELPFVISDRKHVKKVVNNNYEALPEGIFGTVLVAEDNQINLKTAVMMLSRMGYNNLTACNGFEAVELWEKGGVDIILMDIQMPGMDGLEALRQIRQKEVAKGVSAHTPIIALTADALKGTQERLLADGFDAYLSKPVTYQMLQDTLRLFQTTPKH